MLKDGNFIPVAVGHFFIPNACPGVTHTITDRYNTNGVLENGITEALNIAGSAVDVMNNNLNDEKVQIFTKHIWGEGQQQQANVGIVKGTEPLPPLVLRILPR